MNRKITKEKYPIMFDRTVLQRRAVPAWTSFVPCWGPIECLRGKVTSLSIQDVRGRYLSEGGFQDVRPYIPNKKGTQIDEPATPTIRLIG